MLHRHSRECKADPDCSAQIASDDGNASTAASKFYTEANDTYELDYPLVRNGKLSLSKIMHLLQRYKQYYHPYFPLVCLTPGTEVCVF